MFNKNTLTLEYVILTAAFCRPAKLSSSVTVEHEESMVWLTKPILFVRCFVYTPLVVPSSLLDASVLVPEYSTSILQKMLQANVLLYQQIPRGDLNQDY